MSDRGMTKEEAISLLTQVNKILVNSNSWLENTHEPLNMAFDMAIKALEQEPCDNAISRQAVLELVADYDLSMGQIVKGIHALPSVTPQPKTGHWEWVQYDYNPKLGNWHCSECRSVVIECVDKNDKGGIPLYKYCPQCGAKMIEPQESNDKCKNCEYYRNPDYTRCHECKAESEDKE